MADNGIGASLIIPDSVLSKLDEADKKIAKLATTANNASKTVIQAFSEMATGVDPFISQLNKAQLAISNIEKANIGDVLGKGFNNTATEAEKLTKSIVEATTVLNKLNSESNKEQRDKDKAIEREATARRKTTKEIERQTKALAKQQEQEAKAQLGTYSGAMGMSELSIKQRIDKVKQLTIARNNLSKTDANYTKQLETLNLAIRRLNSENASAIAGSKELRLSQNKLMDTAGQLARRLALVFSVSQLTSYVRQLVQIRGEFELQNRALQAILQNKAEADKLFNQITNLAVQSPFQLKELVTYTKQLAAYRIESEKLYDTTKMLADVSAGLGVDMNRLILAFGQVKAANYLRGTELRQFSEAGINILGELADKFSEVEGRAVSVGEVFERVSNRMVTFEDVADVFTKLTAEGGIFYNMQEIQAKTLAGQVSNLRDSFDIMFNEIGKANDGVLKNAVGGVKSLAENWRTVGEVIQVLLYAFGSYQAVMLAVSLTQGRFNKAVGETVVHQTLLQKTLIKSTAIAKGFVTSLTTVGGVVGIAVTAITAIGYAVYKAGERQRELNKQYEETVAKLNTQTTETVKYTGKLIELSKEQNKLLESQKNLNKDSDEYINNQKRLSDIQSERKDTLTELSKYDEILAKSMQQSASDTDVLIEKTEEYNNQLRARLYLEYELKNIDVAKFSKDYNQAMDDTTMATNELISNSPKIIQMMKDFKESGKASTSTKSFIEDFLDSTEPIEKRLLTFHRQSSQVFMDLSYSEKAFINNIGKYSKEYISSRDRMIEVDRKFEKEMEDAFMKISATEEFKSLYADLAELEPDSEKAIMIRNNMRDFLSDALDEKQLVGALRKKADFSWASLIGFDLKKEDIAEPLLDWQNTINNFVADFNKKLDKTGLLLPTIKTQTDRRSDIESDIEKRLQEALRRLDIMQKADKGLYSDTEISNQKVYIDGLQKTYNFLGLIKDEKGKDTMLEVWKNRIEVLKKANKQYEDLRSVMSESEAIDKTKEIMASEFKEYGLDISIYPSFDKKQTVKSLTDMGKTAGVAYQKEFEKSSTPLKTNIEVTDRTRSIEQIGKEIEDVFSGYELSLEMGKLGIDQNILSNMLKELGASTEEIDLLGLNPKTIEEAILEIRFKIKELREQEGLDAIKDAEKYQDMLTKLESKEALNRFNELTTLRDKYNSTDTKVKAVQADISKWEQELANTTNKEQKELLELRIQNGKDAILQLESEALQLTDFWRKLFGDLELTGVQSLDKLLNQSLSIIGSAKKILGKEGQTVGYTATYKDENGVEKQVQLTEQQYQQLLRKTTDISNKIAEKNPFKALFDAFKRGQNEGENYEDYILRLDQYMQSAIAVAGDLANNLADIFGADDNAKQTLNDIMGIIQGGADLGMGVAKITSGDIIGGTVQAVQGIASVVTSINSLHDAKYDKRIEREEKNIEKLTRAYGKLEKAIKNAYSLDTLKQSNKLAKQNLEEQIKSYENMISAEQAKKKTDSDTINEYRNAIEDLKDQLIELKEQEIEALGGFGSAENMRSSAEEFADAWYEAFKETGNGMSGLEDTFNSFMDNVVKKQLLLRGSEAILKPLYEMIDEVVKDGIYSMQDAKDVNDLWENKVKDDLNNFYQSIMGSIGIAGGKGELSGLTKSIQGITEETAQILEALLNSMRFYVSDSNTQIKTIVSIMSSTDGIVNPMLGELRLQTAQMTAINELLSSMSKGGHTEGGKGLKVFIN